MEELEANLEFHVSYPFSLHLLEVSSWSTSTLLVPQLYFTWRLLASLVTPGCLSNQNIVIVGPTWLGSTREILFRCGSIWNFVHQFLMKLQIWKLKYWTLLFDGSPCRTKDSYIIPKICCKIIISMQPSLILTCSYALLSVCEMIV